VPAQMTAAPMEIRAFSRASRAWRETYFGACNAQCTTPQALAFVYRAGTHRRCDGPGGTIAGYGEETAGRRTFTRPWRPYSKSAKYPGTGSDSEADNFAAVVRNCRDAAGMGAPARLPCPAPRRRRGMPRHRAKTGAS
jgi:hypothetical protein